MKSANIMLNIAKRTRLAPEYRNSFQLLCKRMRFALRNNCEIVKFSTLLLVVRIIGKYYSSPIVMIHFLEETFFATKFVLAILASHFHEFCN